MTGCFIAFEGGEGAGKSTQLRRAAELLRGSGHDVLETREPGGTELGRRLRTLLLDPVNEISPRAEALLYAADRAHHVATVIAPALAAGQVVLSDRFLDSTLAYQGAGRGLSIEQARVVTDWATDGLRPDLTVLLDLDPVLGLARAGARSVPDRLESAGGEFHAAVRAGFLQLAGAAPERYLVLDAARPDTVVAAEIGPVLLALVSRLAPVSRRRDI